MLAAGYFLVWFTYFFILAIALFLEIDYDIRACFGLDMPSASADESTHSIFFFMQLYAFYFLGYFLCLNYLSGSRMLGYSLNPEMEWSIYPPLVLMLVGFTLVLFLVLSLSRSPVPLGGSTSTILSFLTTCFVLLFFFYFMNLAASLGLLFLLKVLSLNNFLLTSVGSLFFFVIYYLGALLSLTPVEARVSSSLVLGLSR